jgi:hypothetical protein
MRVVLKQAGTGQFFKDSGYWTNNFLFARDFKTVPAAMDYSQIQGFQGASIVLKFLNADDDFELKNCC